MFRSAEPQAMNTEPNQPVDPSKTGVELIAAERARQINTEGWTPEHDDEHNEFPTGKEGK